MTPEQLRAMRTGQKPQMQQGASSDMMLMDPNAPATAADMAMMESMYNPMLSMGGAPDIRRVDRWLQYNVPNKDDVDKFWVTETALAEELAKANLTKEEYNWFVREYAEIEAIAGGDGNAKWVTSRQRKFMMKLNATRSRSDNKEHGLRDGTLLMTQNVNQKSDVKVPSENLSPGDNGGFFGFLRRK